MVSKAQLYIVEASDGDDMTDEQYTWYISAKNKLPALVRILQDIASNPALGSKTVVNMSFRFNPPYSPVSDYYFSSIRKYLSSATLSTAIVAP